MKNVKWLIILLSVGMLAPGKTMQGQVSLYGEATADYLNSGPYTDFLEGGTAGLLVDLEQGWHSRITFSADLQGNFVYEDSKSSLGVPAFTAGEMYDAVTVGPRFSLAPHFFKLSPYVQANIGFARYHDPVTHSATDSVIGAQAGVIRRLTSRFDAVVDYSYSRFGYNSNFYNPQTFSVGAVYHLVRR
jgi:opacity protein-like surface antigen